MTNFVEWEDLFLLLSQVISFMNEKFFQEDDKYFIRIFNKILLNLSKSKNYSLKK
jgi:hypothetical protein